MNKTPCTHHCACGRSCCIHHTRVPGQCICAKVVRWWPGAARALTCLRECGAFEQTAACACGRCVCECRPRRATAAAGGGGRRGAPAAGICGIRAVAALALSQHGGPHRRRLGAGRNGGVGGAGRPRAALLFECWQRRRQRQRQRGRGWRAGGAAGVPGAAGGGGDRKEGTHSVPADGRSGAGLLGAAAAGECYKSAPCNVPGRSDCLRRRGSLPAAPPVAEAICSHGHHRAPAYVHLLASMLRHAEHRYVTPATLLKSPCP
jgi:hypothetical protein